jgi:hypothetical protein
VSVNDDIEVWLLFAPFWLLGTFALIGSVWHMIHAAIVTRRAQAAGHGHKQDLADKGRHHRKWALIGFGAFVALIIVGVAVRLLMRR